MKKEVKPLGRIIGSFKGFYPKLMAEQLKQKGIKYTFDQMIVLTIIRFCTKTQAIQQDIVEMMKKDKSVILRMIDLLENDNLLYRSTDPKDRRRNILTLTDNGLKYSDLIIEIDKRVTESLLTEVSQNEIDTFYKVLEAIQNKAKEI